MSASAPLVTAGPVPRLSVIICTHNPRQDLLQRTLQALRAQTLPHAEWELLLIDNACTEPLSGRWDLTWQTRARHIREEELGLTPARLRGIREARSDLLLFVDDDNVLDPDYLEQALLMAGRWPMVGVFSGSCRGEFEIPPPASIRPFLSSLAVAEIDREYWANIHEWSLATPLGAGMCLRRPVAEAYRQRVLSRPSLRQLGRRGSILTSGEDNDIVLTAIDLGFGSARFPTLRLTHLITRGRLTEEYIIKLHAGFEFSGLILAADRNRGGARRRPGRLREFRRLLRACLHRQSFERRMEIAKWKARQAAFDFLTQATSDVSLITVRSAR